MKIETPVVEEVLSEIEEVQRIKIGTDEHEKAVKSATTLMDRAIKIEELNLEKRKIENEERKLDVEEQRLEAEKKDRIRKDVITVATSGLSLAAGLLVVMETFRFDLTSTSTSTLGRTILSKWVPKLFK